MTSNFSRLASHPRANVLEAVMKALCRNFLIPHKYLLVQLDLDDRAHLGGGKYLYSLYYNRVQHTKDREHMERSREIANQLGIDPTNPPMWVQVAPIASEVSCFIDGVLQGIALAPKHRKRRNDETHRSHGLAPRRERVRS